MNLEQQIREIVEHHLPDKQYFITEVRAKEGGAKTKVAIYLDGDKGIDIGVCARINKQVGRELEEIQLFSNPYTLEVSSPGLDQPLKLPRQYRRNIGKNIRVFLVDKELEGNLLEVSDAGITINKKSEKGRSEEQKVPFAEIIKTHVLVSF